jgi:putative membrane protein
VNTQFTIWQASAAAVLLLVAILYARGWQRLHRAQPALATRARLVALAAALLALSLALVWPLPIWSNYLLTLRSLQKVLIAMIAAPLLWLSCPVQVIAWEVRGPARRALVALHRGNGLLARTGRALTRPLVTWFAFLGAFLFWHDPQAVPFMVGGGWFHYVAPWLLFGAALLYWWPIVDTGPRLHSRLPAWVLIVYIITVEIPNMVAGVTIAFSAAPLYAHYATLHPAGRALLPLTATTDQVTGGALVWVFGSLVYIAAVVGVLHRLFRREGSTAPHPLAGWDANEKFIAPGLEQRVVQNRLHNVDLSHH